MPIYACFCFSLVFKVPRKWYKDLQLSSAPDAIHGVGTAASAQSLAFAPGTHDGTQGARRTGTPTKSRP